MHGAEFPKGRESMAPGATLNVATVGEPRENGYTERLMRTSKEEEEDLSDNQDYADALRQIARFLDDVYNVKRIHVALGYLKPEEFEEQWRTCTAVGPAATTTLA